jgi:hypothetical protein
MLVQMKMDGKGDYASKGGLFTWPLEDGMFFAGAKAVSEIPNDIVGVKLIQLSQSEEMIFGRGDGCLSGQTISIFNFHFASGRQSGGLCPLLESAEVDLNNSYPNLDIVLNEEA